MAAVERASAVEQEIRQLEKRRAEATVKGDIAELERILADDMTYTHSSASTDTKTSYLDLLRSGQVKYEAVDFEDVSVRVYDSAAVVTGVAHLRVRRSEQVVQLNLKFTDVYVQKEGGWQMVAWQSTRLPE